MSRSRLIPYSENASAAEIDVAVRACKPERSRTRLMSIKAEWFTDFVAKDEEALMERLDKALCWAIKRRDLNRRTCAIRTEI